MNMKTNNSDFHPDDGISDISETIASEGTEESPSKIGNSVMPPNDVDEHSLLHTVEVSTTIRDSVQMKIHLSFSSHNTTIGSMSTLRAIHGYKSARHRPQGTHLPKQRSPQKTLLDAKPITTSV
jgi:hypothetical protein